ncbi:hypothetical protein, partial [Escherichia coli]|uniref:hypothetical protein n=1 Tax=Escherichia coli TaxID=562 RepID=UPI002738084C
EIKWPLLSGAGSGFGKLFLFVLAASLAAVVAAALNIGTIQDDICERTGWCTAQQRLFRSAQECAQRTSACSIGACLA